MNGNIGNTKKNHYASVAPAVDHTYDQEFVRRDRGALLLFADLDSNMLRPTMWGKWLASDSKSLIAPIRSQAQNDWYKKEKGDGRRDPV